MFVQQAVYTVRGNFGTSDRTLAGTFIINEPLTIPTNPSFNDNYATVMELLRVEMQASWDGDRRSNQGSNVAQFGGMTFLGTVPADGIARSSGTKLYCSLTRRQTPQASNLWKNSVFYQWSHFSESAQFNYLGTWEWSMTTGVPSANKPAFATQTEPAEKKIVWDCSDGAGNGILIPEPYLQIDATGTFYTFTDDNAMSALVDADTWAWFDVTLTYRMRNVTTQQALAAKMVMNRLALDIDPSA